MKKLIFFLLALTVICPSFTHASTSDMSIKSSDIRFSNDTFVAGETVRIYIRVRNLGDTDISGYIGFYSGSELINSSQVVTLVADGAYEEVWVDYTIPHSPSFNIRALVKGTSPQDTNSSNDEILTPLYSIIVDDDGDGVDDETDNCLNVSNTSQTDTDGDGAGDACDSDDDNDRLSDSVEDELGTDPIDSDTDNDGYSDADDKYPLDSSKHEEVVVLDLIPVLVQEVIPELFNDDQDSGNGADQIEEESELQAQDQDLESQTALERSSGSVLHVSPNASFVYTRENWKTYAFQSLAHLSTYSVLSWDFSDGSLSSLESVSHEFPSYGTYQVTLRLTDEQGVIHEDIQELTISFFHLSNPFVQIILGLLMVLLIVSIFTTVRTRVGKEAGNKEEIRNEVMEVKAVKKIKSVAKKKTKTKK
ncbi:TPA: hypothetical protein DDY56_02380 [Candidatus Uhrbacteria bacterium]|nr:MAG: hypothetical protein A2317_03390 [Candidatus Uhrbacteria bacterium RIFOXYB2_FULL_41_10]HAL49773.1 hypothetical protein [Candidatus Uhrbacteria bacterium]HAN06136.1 hypothetical protein [Candidatus Uhrbacteria bacterium]HAP65629.1 hypothetical protein [Candidatus Uhrbacteria bacterium]HBA51731.1 hypothetical protein [Candidatus Uhrbacteria bacterium]